MRVSIGQISLTACFRQTNVLIRWIVHVSLFITSVSHAALVTPTETEPVKTVSAVGLGGAWLSTLVALLAVIALILACAWAVKRLGGLQGAQAGALKVIAVMPVGTREKIALVQVGEQQVLVGITPHQINLLQSFEHPIVQCSEPPVSEFAAKLQSLLAKKPDA